MSMTTLGLFCCCAIAGTAAAAMAATPDKIPSQLDLSKTEQVIFLLHRS
jgi:hypothetical protein